MSEASWGWAYVIFGTLLVGAGGLLSFSYVPHNNAVERAFGDLSRAVNGE